MRLDYSLNALISKRLVILREPYATQDQFGIRAILAWKSAASNLLVSTFPEPKMAV